MSIPPGFERKGTTDKVCRLRKALNGLKQSPQAAKVMKNIGYRQNQGDHTIFINIQIPRE